MRDVMARVSTAAAFLAAAVLAFPLAVSAQSLGEAAEKAKRERKGKTKVITETELRRGTLEPPVTSAETTEASDSKETPKDGAAAAAPAKPAEKTDDELRAEAEAKWRERVQKAEADVTRLRDEASQIQTALNDVSQNMYGANRASLLNRLESVNKDLAAAQQSVSDLQEEGRRSRYRP
jgi:hypothetical protein